MHHSTLWKSWNMQSGLGMLKKTRFHVLAQILTSTPVQSKKKLTALSHQCRRSSSSPTHTFLRGCQQGTARWERSLRSMVPKSSKLLCQSLNREIRSTSKTMSVHSTCSQLWGHCSCTLYAPISSFTLAVGASANRIKSLLRPAVGLKE